MNLANIFEQPEDLAVFVVDGEQAYKRVMDKFGHIIEWNGDYMVAPRKVFNQIEEIVYSAGGEVEEVTGDEWPLREGTDACPVCGQTPCNCTHINEATGLTFMGSPCTKDCSGHKAGYEWSEKRGGQTANSHSQSFNNGAAINANQHKPKTPPKAQQPKDAADRLRDKQAELVGPDNAKTLGLAETKVSKYKDLGATNQTTHFIKNVTTGKVVSPHRSRQDAEDALVAHYRTSGSDEYKIVRARKEGVVEGKFNELSIMLADYHNSNISDVKFYGMYGKTRQQVAKEYANYLEEDVGGEFGQKELKHTIARARAKFPRAASDTEALIMYVQDQEQQDVRKLDQVNDREDKEIDRLDKEEDSIELRLQNVERKLSNMTETRLYYNVVSTPNNVLRFDFGLEKDRNGWYLKESADPKVKYTVYKAFGHPKLKEYDLSAVRGGSTGVIKGADNPVSPVGSVPRGQQKTRR